MCTVLINISFNTENNPIIMPKRGTCADCKDVCPVGVIHGATWNTDVDRDLIVDVYNCSTCLKCLSNCPWT